MTTDRDPPRLHETSDVDAGVRNVFRAAKDELPDATRMDQMLSGLRSKISGPSGGGDGGPDPGASDAGAGAGGATKGSLSAVTKIAATTIAAGALGVLVVTTRGQSPKDAETAPPQAASTAPLAPPSQAIAPASVTSPAPSASAAAVDAIPIDLLPSAPRAASSSPRTSPAPSELTLLKDAQAALANDPARSLEIVARHERTFPKAEFSEEREVIRIDALVRLGRLADARARGERFHARFPASAHRARVDALLPK